MEANNFWLISVDESSVVVSLLINNVHICSVASIGPIIEWDDSIEDSFVTSVDESLTQAGALASISDDQEPVSAAIILPPFWVGSDGRILPDKLKLIASACKKLDLKPIGFIPDDEAIVEQTNSDDGFPSSFILLHLSKNSFILTLVYLGKIKQRIRRDFEGDFNPSLVESALIDLRAELTLPPQIVVFGTPSETAISNLKNFAWVGKKDAETFLHFPDIKSYSIDETINIYAVAITSQLKLSLSTKVDEVDKTEIEAKPEEEELQPDNSESQESDPQGELEPMLDTYEVEATELNFSPVFDFNSSPPTEAETEVEDDVDPITAAPHAFSSSPEPVISSFSRPKFKFNYPKLKIPRFKIKFPTSSFFILAALPLFVLIPFFFGKANITLFVTPYNFSKNTPITLSSVATSLDLANRVIPVEKKEFTINSSSSIKTTGKKTVGTPSQGEIIIYNKQDRTQTLAKGAILTDSTGKKYQLVNAVSVASSSSNLDQGIITLGQTKTVVQSTDIGPDFNQNKDTQLNFKDFAQTVLIAKVTEGLTGGTKQDISAVSAEDKKALEQQINDAVVTETNNKVKNDLSSLSGIIDGSIQNNRSRVEYSREIGEEADTLNATVNASVSVFLFNPDQKLAVINGLLSSESNFSDSIVNTDNFNFIFKLDKIDSSKASGTLTLTGTASPKIDINSIKSKIKGKFKASAGNIIKKSIGRVYNYTIKTNMSFIDFINPLPFLINNINIEVKS